jgi:Ca-activated chloride channel family protein
METRDMVDLEGRRIDRLEAVKQVLVDFVGRREGDRIGLLLFGTAPYLQVPFTLDHEVVAALLEEAQVAMTGPQTMLGDAIGLAIKVFEESEAPQRVLILLTDGNDTGSRVPPDQAAEIAAARDITIHTIGFGDPRAGGEGLFDAAALEAIARNGGGVSFMADDREALERVYLELDQIEPQEYETLSYRPTRPLYPWPLGAALALLLTYHAAMALTMAARGRVSRHG